MFVYSWLTWMDGDSSLGPVDTGVDVDVSDLLDALEFSGSARYRGQTDDWSVVVDGIYASFGVRGEGPLRTDFDLNQIVLQADFGWRFSPESELFGGVRYVRLESEVKVRPPAGEVRHEADVSLWDPVVGLRTIRELRPRWLFQGQVDAGGGANMDFTWQAMAHVGYHPGERYGFWLGFRALGIDFDEGGDIELDDTLWLITLGGRL